MRIDDFPKRIWPEPPDVLTSLKSKTESSREPHQPNLLSELLTAREMEEVKRHKYYMSEIVGYDVGYEAASTDWLVNHAGEFRRQVSERMLAMQKEEIGRHKWIESEKAIRDLGSDTTLDFFAKLWVEWKAWLGVRRA